MAKSKAPVTVYTANDPMFWALTVPYRLNKDGELKPMADNARNRNSRFGKYDFELRDHKITSCSGTVDDGKRGVGPRGYEVLARNRYSLANAAKIARSIGVEGGDTYLVTGSADDLPRKVTAAQAKRFRRAATAGARLAARG